MNPLNYCISLRISNSYRFGLNSIIVYLVWKYFHLQLIYMSRTNVDYS